MIEKIGHFKLGLVINFKVATKIGNEILNSTWISLHLRVAG